MRASWITSSSRAGLIGACCLAVATVVAALVVAWSGSAHAQGSKGSGSSAPTSSPSTARINPTPRINTQFAVASATRVAQTGHAITVVGRLKPARAGERVSLLAQDGGRWVTVGRGVTQRSGRFVASALIRSGGAHALRVRFAGDRAAQPASTQIGLEVAMTPAVVSWYYDEGNTACGFHARYGVANRTLPCGSRVQLEYGGRVVTATVDDRGPFVTGRTFDLDQATAAALHMDGVATVMAS
jgi:rare lipoprotein A